MGKVGEVRFGKSELNELGEMSKLGGLGRASFGMSKLKYWSLSKVKYLNFGAKN